MNNDWLQTNKDEFFYADHFSIIMSSDKQVGDEDNETVASSTEKTNEQEDAKSQSSNSDNDDTDSNASSEYEVVSDNGNFHFSWDYLVIFLRKKFFLNVDDVAVDLNITSNGLVMICQQTNGSQKKV